MSAELTVTALRADGSVEPAFRFEVLDASVTATCTAAEPVEAGLRVELRLPPTDDPGWLVPGLFYGENRPAGCLRLFPRFVPHVPPPHAGARVDQHGHPPAVPLRRVGRRRLPQKRPRERRRQEADRQPPQAEQEPVLDPAAARDPRRRRREATSATTR